MQYVLGFKVLRLFGGKTILIDIDLVTAVTIPAFNS
jgi:hypothetical protein